MPLIPLSRPLRVAALAVLAALSLPPAALAASDPNDHRPTPEWPQVPPTPQAGKWKNNGGTYYRLEADGNLSCYSEDGVNCRPGKPSDDETVIQPLVCGAAHKGRYGVTGYDTAGHWCNDVYANRFAKWQDYSPLRIPVFLSKTPNNDPMCLSYDGVSCQWGKLGEPMLPPQPGKIRPLVCGKAHQARQQGTGYEPSIPGHWCQSREIVTSHRDRPEMETTRGMNHTQTQTFQLADWSMARAPELFSRAMSSIGESTRVVISDRDGNGMSLLRKGASHGPRTVLAQRINDAGKLETHALTGAWVGAVRATQVEGALISGQAANTLTIEYRDVPSGFTLPDPEFVLSLKREPPRD